MSESYQVSIFLIGVSAERLYRAWLDGKAHAAFTGAGAQVDPRVGGAFTAWDGYISGTNLELSPHRRIVQAWRTTEFLQGSPDSRLEISFEEDEGGTRLTLAHSDIPDGQGESYRQGWEDYYFKPMLDYFSSEEAD